MLTKLIRRWWPFARRPTARPGKVCAGKGCPQSFPAVVLPALYIKSNLQGEQLPYMLQIPVGQAAFVLPISFAITASARYWQPPGATPAGSDRRPPPFTRN